MFNNDIIKEGSNKECLYMFHKNFYAKPRETVEELFNYQDENKFFRLCVNWLACNETELIEEYLDRIHWKHLYCLVGTPLEEKMFCKVKNQIIEDIQSNHPSDLAKYLKSENASSVETKHLANITKDNLNMTHREYRKTLSSLRKRIGDSQ